MPGGGDNGGAAVGGRWEALYRRYHDRLIAHVVGRTGDLALAEDVAHDVLLAARAQLVAGGSSPTWPRLARTAARVASARQRRDDELIHLPVERLGELLAGVEPDDASRAAVRAALDRLPPRERLVLSFLYDDGWSPEAVAFLLGVDDVALGRLLERASRRLRAELRRGYGPAALLGPWLWARRRLGDAWQRVHLDGTGASTTLVRLAASRPALLAAGVLAVVAVGSGVADGPTPAPTAKRATAATPAEATTPTSAVLAAEDTAGGGLQHEPTTGRAASRSEDSDVLLRPRVEARRTPDKTTYLVEPIQAPPPTDTGDTDDPIAPGADFECPDDPSSAALAIGCPVVDVTSRLVPEA